MKKHSLLIGLALIFSLRADRLLADIRFEQTDSGVVYTGNWTTLADPNASGGSYRTSTDAATPANARFTFTGTGVSWITDTGPVLGIGAVYIDGVLDANVDLYRAVGSYQVKVYSKSGLASGSHTIWVRVTGTANPASTGTAVTIDALEVKYASFRVRTDLNPLSSFPRDAGFTGVIQPYVLDFGVPSDGYRFWCYYNPFPPESSEVVWLVRSNDGISWTAAGVTNPMLPAPSGFNNAAHPAVVGSGTTWYMFVDGLQFSKNKWVIYYATASDPKGPWTYQNVLLTPSVGWEGASIGAARVARDGGIWKMWYDNADTIGSTVGYATASSPGGPWTKYSGNPIFSGVDWDSSSIHHKDIIKDGNMWVMLYVAHNGDGKNRLGIAASTDGLTWWREQSGPVLSPGSGTWDSAMLYMGTIRRINGSLKIWYTGSKSLDIDAGQGSIGLAEDLQSGPLSVTTAALPPGWLNVPYSASVTAAGGSPPYTWAVTSGALPNNLSLAAGSGAISGTPTVSGTFYFTVTATDSVGARASKPLSIFVSSDLPPRTPTAPVGPSRGMPAVAYTYSTSTTDPQNYQLTYTFDWGDGTTTTTSPLPSGTTASASHSWAAAGTFSVKVFATNPSGLKSSWSPVLVVTMVSSTPTRFEENHSAVSYLGTWTSLSDPNASGGTYTHSNDSTTPASATFTFTGTQVAWISDTWTDMGKANVYIDGVFDATVDMYSASGAYQQVVYRKSGLVSATHTLKIVVTGTKNASSSDVWIDIDAFDVWN